MPSETFELLKTDHIPSLNLGVEDYRHKVTGARHLHLAGADDNNVFMVAFMTKPQDSTGVAHILEHTSLCGSERFPVRDPFFMMLRRSLNNFMNAFTSSDWTAYPFATQNRKDFDNLLQVYLDAAFFPRLHELDFLQEGHRLEFAEPDNPDSELVFKGVVFNEMKGAMSAPSRVLGSALQAELYPTTTYHHNSGGEPERIPDLTWEDLKAFHARHYHPSNATFLTYGDIPAASQQQKFEQYALGRFQHKGERFMVGAETRLTAPRNAEIQYAFDADEDPARRSHVVVGWLLGETARLDELIDAHLLAGVLLDNSASPLRQALESTDLGSAPSELCGLDDDAKEFNFVAGLEGARAEDAAAIEDMIMNVLREVAADGVACAQVESVLHQLELSQREIGGDGFPFGLKLMLSALPAALHGGEPAAVLNIDPALERLREDIKDAGFIPRLTRKFLLDNPHRVRMVMAPDKSLNRAKQDAERERLAAIRARLGANEKQDIIDTARKLAARQDEQDDPGLLPSVSLSDINADIRVTEGEQHARDGIRLACYPTATNGLAYAHVLGVLPEMEAELLEVFPLFCHMLTEVGVAGRDYLQTAAWQSAVTGGLNARYATRGDLRDGAKARVSFILCGKALNRNIPALADILVSTLAAARFDEATRLRELIAQLRAQQEAAITGHGHNLAMLAAAATLSPAAALRHHWDGLAAVRQIKALDESLRSDQSLRQFTERLHRVREIVGAACNELLLISEDARLQALQDAFIERIQAASLSAAGGRAAYAPTVAGRAVKQAWLTGAQVNFCAQAFAAVPAEHADAAAFTVLGGYLRNGFLHTAIREKGGAYGGGAGYDSDAAAFRFYSYRDPRMAETLRDYRASLQWLGDDNSGHAPRLLEEAILGVIAALDRPRSPAGEAATAFYAERCGRDPAQRRRFRQRVLNVTLADLRRVVERYLGAEQAHTAVIADPSQREAVKSLGLQAIRI